MHTIHNRIFTIESQYFSLPRDCDIVSYANTFGPQV